MIVMKDKMESSISSLTYNGSISEAITEARQQKKLFLVYISGTYTVILISDHLKFQVFSS